MSAPLWLSSNAICYLLDFVVDKLDAAQAQGKSLNRAIRLDERSFPALFKADFEADKERLWEHVEQMAAWGWICIRHDRLQRGQAKYECNPRIDILDEPAVRTTVGRHNRVLSTNELWRNAVYSGLDAPEDVREVVARLKIEIPGRSAAEIVTQLNLLQIMKDEPLLLREASARLFWGLSKVFDKRQPLLAALLQTKECPFPEMPVQLQVFLPAAGFNGVLFIENQTTFEQATRDESERFACLALVFASGFKGSAKRLRAEGGASAYIAAHGALAENATSQFLGWLRGRRDELPVWFWGDLDYSGMQILSSLRASFPGLDAWKPGYAPMLTALESGGGHEPESGGKKSQKVVPATGSEYADEVLIPAIEHTGRFVDQELV
jgi:hypothetical protein